MNNNEEGNSGKKNFRIQLIGPAIITLIPVVAYLLGISFYQGYLSTFGVNSDIFPISTQYVYLHAYYAVTHILLYFLFNIIELIIQINWCSGIIILLTICIMTGISWFSKRRDRFSAIKFIENCIAFLANWRNNELAKSTGVIWMVFSFLSLLFYCLLFMFFFWWSPSRVAYLAGQNIAEEKIGKFTKNGCFSDPKIKIDSVAIDTCSVIQDKNGKILHEGLLVAINDKDIALFKKDGSYIFPRQKDWVIQRKLHKNP